MKRALKWIGIMLVGLVAILVVAAAIGFTRGSSYLTRQYDYQLDPIDIPTDTESIANGEYLATSLGLCTACHGEDFAGQELINDPGFLVLYATNLTDGRGGIGATYSDEDYVRSLRHGIRPNGENLLVMPAQFFNKLSAKDVGDIIAFLKSLPPVDNEIPERQVMFLPRILIGLGMIPPEEASEIFPASAIDHQNNAPPTAPAKGVTAEWGEYRALVCTACHGENLAGRPADPENDVVAAPNLTPGGELVAWSLEDFITTLRTGVTPTGREMDPEEMPWKEFALATDDDLTAIFMFLQSQPALETNQ